MDVNLARHRDDHDSINVLRGYPEIHPLTLAHRRVSWGPMRGSGTDPGPSASDSPTALDPVLGRMAAGRPDRLRHHVVLPAREPVLADWPDWAPEPVVMALAGSGIQQPWAHQVQAADLAHGGQHVAIATGTASGKSLAYWLPVLSAVHEGLTAANGRGATALYLAPTKALGHDQLRSLAAIDLAGLRATVVDGDTPAEERAWARSHANVIVTNPDLVHFTLLASHQQWASFLRRLRYVVIDEAHTYRGVFGAHVSAVLRRLLRVCDRYGAHPTFIAASATIAEPGAFLERMIGTAAEQITLDCSPAPQRTVALWEPGLTLGADQSKGTPTRRSAAAEAADLLTDLVVEGRQSIAFIRSRRGAEAVAAMVRDRLAEVDPDLVSGVASYRGGYLPEERRDLEKRLRSGQIQALASTNALELGIDISGLDAVITAGWPGTRASIWQQFGRAGRTNSAALAMFVSRDDPLDAYVVSHPEALLGEPVEAIVIDPSNPVVLGPHLCAAAAELPITDEEAIRWFGAGAPAILAALGAEGLLRRRPTGWFWTSRDRATDLADLRGTGGAPITIVEDGTGRILGTVDSASSHAQIHTGAVYTHQGVTHLVLDLDLDARVATVQEQPVDFTTNAREVSDIRITSEQQSIPWGEGTMSFGEVQVTAQVVSFQRRRVITGEVLGEQGLDLPERLLTTKAVWWTLSPDQIEAAGVDELDVPGAAHAAEHASIGLLPLFATCDRWDIGGVSTACHPDTGRATVFVYDGLNGGAGFAERGFEVARAWLQATHDLILTCPCDQGCPSCIQSPKCGNGNNPLDKGGAVRLLAQLLTG